MVTPAHLQKFRRLLAEGTSLEKVLLEIRRHGFSKLQSIAIVRTISDVTLGGAKEIVHHSAVWRDRSDADEEFGRDIADSLEELEAEEIADSEEPSDPQ